MLLGLLGLSLVALRSRALLQSWVYGIGKDARRLVGHPVPELPRTVRPLPSEARLPTLRLADLRGQVVLLHFWTFG